jgi:hypothetical protein
MSIVDILNTRPNISQDVFSRFTGILFLAFYFSNLSGFSENLHPTLRLVPDGGGDGCAIDRRPGPTAGGGGGGGPAAQVAGTAAPAGQRLRSPGSTGVQPVGKQRGKPKYCKSGTLYCRGWLGDYTTKFN